jgi:hypothetical protein
MPGLVTARGGRLSAQALRRLPPSRDPQSRRRYYWGRSLGACARRPHRGDTRKDVREMPGVGGARKEIPISPSLMGFCFVRFSLRTISGSGPPNGLSWMRWRVALPTSALEASTVSRSLLFRNRWALTARARAQLFALLRGSPVSLVTGRNIQSGFAVRPGGKCGFCLMPEPLRLQAYATAPHCNSASLIAARAKGVPRTSAGSALFGKGWW